MLDDDGCVHHWMIEPAEKATSLGTCKYCGEIRQFYNHISSSISPADMSELITISSDDYHRTSKEEGED